AAARAPAAGDDRFAPGIAVRHATWGLGEIQRVEDGHLVVLFDHVGYKTLALDVVRDRQLLEPA
ncbi:MAG: putative ATP-dependent helicase RecQ, partial [Conexibacter sp.]|nr:putative ATP-dependent helicase RecQ [Conexibacter sp.]